MLNSVRILTSKAVADFVVFCPDPRAFLAVTKTFSNAHCWISAGISPDLLSHRNGFASALSVIRFHAKTVKTADFQIKSGFAL